VIDFPAAEATGSHRSSCGHLFHPKCIAKWHIRQEESTCPMCRKVATELEDCAIEEEEDEEDEDDDEDDEEEELPGEYGTIQIPRLALDALMRQQGGIGVTSGVMAEVLFDEFDEVTIWRYELERILREQGGARFSDAQWDQLQSVYPAEDEDDEPVAAVMAPLQLTFAEWQSDASPPPLEQAGPTQRARELLANPAPPASVVTPEDVEAWELVLDSARATIARHAAAERHQSRQHPCPMEFFTAGDIPPTYGVTMSVPCDICKTQQLTIPFYHCATCQFDICAECFMPPAAPAPGPFDAGEPHQFTLHGFGCSFRRADIQRLLQTHGSMATVEEFFNEDMGGDQEETLVVTMTLESLNNRFASLRASPVTFMEAIIAVATPTRETLQITAFNDGARDVVSSRQQVILNPEDE
jgi:hypothetical protein